MRSIESLYLSRGLLAVIGTIMTLAGLAASPPPADLEDPAPYVLQAESEHLPSVADARPIYDGRPQRAQAEVIRTDCPGGQCPFSSAISRVHQATTKAQGEAVSGVFTYRVRIRSGPLFPNRPRLFR